MNSNNNNESTSAKLLPPLWVLTIAAFVLLFWLLTELKEMVVLLVVGYSIAYVIDPLLVKLEKLKVNRSVGFFVVFSVFVIAVALLALTAFPTVIKEYQSLAQNFPNYIEVAKERLSPHAAELREYLPKKMAEEEGALFEMLPAGSAETLNKFLVGAGKFLLQGYNVTLTALNLFLLPFIVFYISVSFRQIHDFALSLVPLKWRDRVESLVTEIDRDVSAFVRGQLLVGAVLFILYALGLAVIGVELWFLLAVIAGFGNVIPYFGTLIGIVLTTIMTLVTFGDMTHLLYVWGWFGIVQFVEGTFVTPKIVGEKVGLSPLLVILSIFTGGKLFGLLGIFLAVPGAAVLRVVLGEMHEWVLREIGDSQPDSGSRPETETESL